MTKIVIGREMVDLAPIFQALPERNYLYQCPRPLRRSRCSESESGGDTASG